jgi:hypothetical protein
MGNIFFCEKKMENVLIVYSPQLDFFRVPDFYYNVFR